MHLGRDLRVGKRSQSNWGCPSCPNISWWASLQKAGDRGAVARASGDYAIVVSHNPDAGITRIKLPSGSKKVCDSLVTRSMLHIRLLPEDAQGIAFVFDARSRGLERVTRCFCTSRTFCGLQLSIDDEEEDRGLRAESKYLVVWDVLVDSQALARRLKACVGCRSFPATAVRW